MCHVLLAMPFLALIAFWVWPLSIALPVYLSVLALSLLLYAYITKAIRRPVETGREALLRQVGEVIASEGNKVMVRVQNEIWIAEPVGGRLNKGDSVRVLKIDGLTLSVAKLRDNP